MSVFCLAISTRSWYFAMRGEVSSVIEVSILSEQDHFQQVTFTIFCHLHQYWSSRLLTVIQSTNLNGTSE